MIRWTIPLAIAAAAVATHCMGGPHATAALSGMVTDPDEVCMGVAYTVLRIVCYVVLPPWLLTSVARTWWEVYCRRSS